MKRRQVLVGPLPVPSQVGDAAIAAGAVRLVRTAFPEAEVSGWAGTFRPGHREAIADFIRTYDLDSLVYSPLSLERIADQPSDGVLQRTREGIGEIVQALGKYAVPRLGRLLGPAVRKFLPGDLRPIVSAIARADLVVMRGGGYLTSPHLLCDLLGFRLNALNEVSIARGLGKPYAIWGHTVWDLDGPLSKRMFWPIIADSQATICREQRSYDYLVQEGAPDEKLAVLPDTAFALEPVSGDRVDRALEYEGLSGSRPPLVGINVRPPRASEGDRADFTTHYLTSVAAAARHLSAEYGAHPLLFSHCHSTPLHRVPSFQDERALIEDLAARLPDCTMVRGEYSPAELVGIYGRLEMMFTTRLHAGILASTAGTPAAFIAYEQNKTYGIADMLTLADYVLPLPDVSERACVELVDRLWHDRAERRRRLAEALADIRTELQGYVRIAHEAVRAET